MVIVLKMGHPLKPMVETRSTTYTNNKTPALELVKLISISTVFRLMF